MRLRDWRTAAAALGLLAALTHAGCTVEPRPALRLGTNVWTGYEPLYLARELGPRQRRRTDARMRLRDADGALVAPGEFLPAAERYNLMPAIDRWVIRALFARHGTPPRAGRWCRSTCRGRA